MAGTTFSSGPGRGGITGINVTPMVDIMLVLLVIMMVSDGPGGIAIAAAAPQPVAPPVRQAAVKQLSAPAPPPEAGCSEAETKPKATSMPHPAYTEDARAAAIEGKVRVELTVDEAGHVSAARVIEGLGHGLDEAAVDAVRGAVFAPATRCGKAVPATFTVSVRFAL